MKLSGVFSTPCPTPVEEHAVFLCRPTQCMNYIECDSGEALKLEDAAARCSLRDYIDSLLTRQMHYQTSPG